MKHTALKKKKPYSVQSLTRGLRILDALAEADGDLGMQEISRRVDLNISTVFRLIQTLEECGLVGKDRETGRYRVGMKLLGWSSRVLQAMDIRRQATPFLQELNEETRETVHLTVRDGDAAMYAVKFDSPIPLRIYSELGKRAPLHCTGVGKVLLAFTSREDRHSWLQRNSLHKFTQSTITEKKRLEKELGKISSQGYALDNEEHEPHVRCVAAPVFDYTGNIVAAISVTVPSVRMTKNRIAVLIRSVKETAEKISGSLGYRQK